MTSTLTARVATGLSARTSAPLDSHAELGDATHRPDPIAILEEQATSRVPELVPIRHGRMSVSPFTFYRGAAAVMATDLAQTPSSDLVTQLCGDAHLSNFGVFASPERRLMFDLNDFDETHPGPFEWDVKRLTASLVIAARENAIGRKARAEIVRDTVGRYRQAMGLFAQMRELDVWYSKADIDELGPQLAQQLDKARRKRWTKAQEKVRTHNSVQAMAKLTAVVDGRRRIIADPPLVVPVSQIMPDTEYTAFQEQIRLLLANYRRTLQPDRRHLFDSFEFVDMARKVVGVGSVGTRCWILLLTGRDDGDPLLLQAKEAQDSVLAEHLAKRGVRDKYPTNGQRVVCGQRLMQAASDIFLGWETADGIDGRRRDFYVRQLRDWKGSAIVEDMNAATMRVYGALCGWTLARAHARSGDRIAIAGYLGDTDAFDQAIVEFSERYADRNEGDFAAIGEAIRSGRIEAQIGL